MPTPVIWTCALASVPDIDLEKRLGSLERALKRERHRREQAETLLETKSRELFHANKELSDERENLVARNAELESARESLVAIHHTLQESYATTVEVFARLIQSRAGLGTRMSVARDAVELGEQLGLNEKERDSLYKAALLCDIGKLSLPDESVHTPYTRLEANAQREYHRHPIVAEATLLSIEPLAEAATIIRLHCERVDGSGFPDKLEADQIPLPSRILAVTKAFADLIDGHLLPKQLTISEAREFLDEQKGKRYDAEIVERFDKWLDSRRRVRDEVRERKRTLGSLRAGAKVARDVSDANGVLILAKGVRLTNSMIDKLARLQEALEKPLVVYTEEA